MSANNTVRRNGMVEMAAVEGLHVWWENDRQKAQRVKRGVSIEDMRIAAGMDWKIGRSRVRYGEGANQLIWEDHHVLFRSDTKEPLGLVSDKYKVVQPAQVLEMFRDVCADGGATLETAGTLYGGKQFWCLAKLDGAQADVGKGDTMLGYLLGVTSADGSLRTTLTETTVAVVCSNTMQMALGERGRRIAVSHRSEMTEEKLRDMKQSLAQSGKNFKAYMEASRTLAKAKIGMRDASAFIEELLRDQKLISAEDATKAKSFTEIMKLFDGQQLGGELSSRRETLWGLVNAVTEYVDHKAPAKNLSLKMANSWFGRGDTLKSAAMAKALALV